MSDYRDDRVRGEEERRPDVPPLLWGILGLIVVAVFVLALRILGPIS